MSQSDDRPDEQVNEQPAPAAPAAEEKTGDEAVAAQPAANRRTVVLASVIAVVVLIVAGVVIYALTSGDDSADQADGRDVPTITGSAPPSEAVPEQPQSEIAPPATGAATTGATNGGAAGEAAAAESVAEQAAAAISSADVTTLSQLSCDPANAVTEETFPADAKAEVVGEPQITGDTATVDLKLTIGQNEPATVPMPLVKKDGRWCVPS